MAPSRYGFATGTPNVSKDGFPVTVHNDEAIVPLPDGRRVPVELRGQEDLAQRIAALVRPQMSGTFMSDDYGGGRGAQSMRPVINLTMNINAKDADSFNRSRTQILQMMQRDLRRANRQLGDPGSGVDDPTRRG